MRRLLALAAAIMLTAVVVPAGAETGDPRLIQRLNEDQRRIYQTWREARAAHERRQDAYWSAVVQRRAERRRKIGAGLTVTAADFVMQQPPQYKGPPLRPDIARMMAELAPPAEPSEITTLQEMRDAARQIYRFQPTLVAEREFKRRYAQEALAAGLTREEVTRIFAFETGGRGTFDMQAGINPETRQGREISTALGYAQLLAANSIDELVRYGDGFVSRLGMMAARPGTPRERARELVAKIEVLKAMMRTGRSVPREWSRHIELARTPRGYAIHTLNLDGDIGPWLQVIKLKGIKETAEQVGRANLSPAELELMNLAGPRTGLEMMERVGAAAPTANFFSRAAYYRNTIVREKTAGELLAAIEHRMNENMKRPGSQEFVAAFEEVGGGARQATFEERRQLVPDATAYRRVAQPISYPAPPATEGPVPPLPVRAEPPRAVPVQAPVVPPAPVRATRPAPSPRFDWAPPAMRGPPGLPSGFPD